jgi:hypothetical protein
MRCYQNVDQKIKNKHYCAWGHMVSIKNEKFKKKYYEIESLYPEHFEGDEDKEIYEKEMRKLHKEHCVVCNEIIH